MKIILKESFPIVTDDNNKWLGDYEEIIDMYEEPLLKKNSMVYSMYPIQYTDIYEMYKKARASYWQPEEVSLVNDLKKNGFSFIIQIIMIIIL